MKTLPPRLPVVLEDQILYWMRNSHDEDIRLVAELNGTVDADRMERAANLLLETMPVLGCRFVKRAFRSYWERIHESGDSGVFRLVEPAKPSLDWMLTADRPTDVHKGPQFKVRLYRSRGRDTLVIHLNHTAGDGGGAKDTAYALASIYNALEANPGFKPEPTPPLRSMKQMTQHLGAADRLKILAQGPVETARFFFPMALSKGAVHERLPESAFVTRRLAPPRTRAMKEFGKSLDATVNDVLTAALFRAFFSVLNPHARVPRTVGTVDLRRYIPGGRAHTVCNLSGFSYLSLESGLGPDMRATTLRVRDRMNRLKKNYLGLANIPFTAAVFKALPFDAGLAIHDVLGKVQKNQTAGAGHRALLCSNTGTIAPGEMVFGDTAAENAFITTPAAYPPVVAVCMTGFNDFINLSAGFQEAVATRTEAERFLEAVENELP